MKRLAALLLLVACPPILAGQESLAEVAKAARDAVLRGDFGSLVPSPAGVQLRLPGVEPSGSMGRAQYNATMRDAFRRTETSDVTIEDFREVGGGRAFVELQREYRVLRDGRWVPTAGQPLRDGDWVCVTLRLDTAAERRFVALTDAVPGGLRPTDLALSGVAGVDLQAVSDEGSGWFRTRRTDPRAPKFHAEVLPAGRPEVHYLARVGNAGDYPPAPARAGRPRP